MSTYDRVSTFFRGARAEFRHISWPTRRRVIRDTAIVLLSGLVAMIIVGLLDLGLTKLVEFLVSYQ